jgi:hypothetical protein
VSLVALGGVGDAIDVAFIDDVAVGVEEVERNRRVAAVPGPGAVDRRCGGSVRMPWRVQPIE